MISVVADRVEILAAELEGGMLSGAGDIFSTFSKVIIHHIKEQKKIEKGDQIKRSRRK